MSNPLFADSALPLFQQIKPEHAVSAMKQLLQESQQRIDDMTYSADTPTWANLMASLEDISARIHDVWSPIGHLNAVNNTPEWREAYNACLPGLTEFSTNLGQNRALYEKIKTLSESSEFDTFDNIQKKIITDQLRDFILSGVALDGENKQRYADIQQRLSELTTKFEENVLDATQNWFYELSLSRGIRPEMQETWLRGLPEHIIQFAQAKAHEKNIDGYVFTLDAPCYIAVMKYAENRELRHQMYTAYTTRASDQGPDAGKFDNTPVILELLALKEEVSKLLGFENYAEYSLETKMASTSSQVKDFLRDLAKKTRPFAEQEIIELKQFAREQLSLEDMQAWDVAFVSEKLQQNKYAFNEEVLRPYFPINKVLSGMFGVIEKIYGMRVVELPSASPLAACAGEWPSSCSGQSQNQQGATSPGLRHSLSNIEVWCEDVRFFQIFDEKNHLRGQFYLDLFARDRKRGGAWMDDCRSRRRVDGKIFIPVAYLNCNFAPPQKDQPALLTHDDVITLFHEFGHGLHHMLTQVDYGQVSGISGVEWDAVELPSQFMENFCWQQECIPMLSEHFLTKEPLPGHLFSAMLQAKNFQSAMHMLRQIEFALFDIVLYSQQAPEHAVALQNTLDQVRNEVAVIIPPGFNRFQHSFSHIFAGGYAAGYYSYKWAEVLSSDAFSKFEENGILDRKTGLEFLQAILEQGGSSPAMVLFQAFRGREPNVDALLRHSGLINE